MYDLPDAHAASQLNKHNYLFWAILMESLLVIRGHWDVVDGSYPQPATAMEDEYHQWRLMDRRAWCDITAFCSQEDWWWYKRETAKELWDRLEKMKKPFARRAS